VYGVVCFGPNPRIGHHSPVVERRQRNEYRQIDHALSPLLLPFRRSSLLDLDLKQRNAEREFHSLEVLRTVLVRCGDDMSAEDGGGDLRGDC
jgi:hypothetical protein